MAAPTLTNDLDFAVADDEDVSSFAVADPEDLSGFAVADEISPDVISEAQRTTAGALQAVDLMTLPQRISAAQPRELSKDEQLFQQAESVAAQMRQAEETGQSSAGLSDQYFALRDQIDPNFLRQVGDKQFTPDEVTPVSAPDGFREANWLGRGLSEIAQAAGLTPLAGDIEAAGRSPIGMNFQANIGGAALGAAGAGLMMVPGAQPLGARTFAQMAAPMAGPMIGGITGGLAGNVAQEKIHAATETPEENEARHEALAELQQYFPAQSMLGASMANIFTMRPSLSQFLQAAGGNKNAQMAIAGAAGIGASMGIAMPMITGQPVTMGGIAQSTLENMIFNKPTRLGRAMGLPPMDGGPAPHEVEPVEIVSEPTPLAPDAGIPVSPEPSVAPEATPIVEPVSPVAEPPVVEPTPEVVVEPTPAPEATPPAPEPTGPVVGDVGSALPPPKPPVAGEGEPTGIRNAVVDRARAEAGIPPRELPLARSFPQIHAEASAALANDPSRGARLVDELVENIRPLDDTDDAILTFEQNSREQERAAAVEAVNRSQPGEERDAVVARLAAADDALFTIYQVGQQAGTANARGLNARKMMQNRDFTLSKMLNDTRAIVNNGDPLTTKQTEETTALYNRINDLEKEVAGLRSKETSKSAKSEFQKIIRQTKKEAGEAAKAKEGNQSFIQRTRENARNRIIGRRGKLQVTVDPLNIAGLADEAVIGATYVAEGVRDFAKWSDSMIGEFGERIRPHLEALFQRAAVLGDDISKEYNAKAPKTPEAILSGIKDGAKLEQRTVYDLARAHVNAGMEDFDQVMSRVTEDLKPRFPDVDESKVRRTLSDYGKINTPSKEADLVKLREFRNLARLRSQLEDAEKKLAPLKTGMQRDKATQEVRELQKKVKDAMRASGISATSPESQLASAHTARVTRLKNSIEDTQAAIDAGKRPDKHTPVPWTPEELALKDQLTELNARLDAALDQPDNAQLERLLRRAEVVAERIKSGEIGAKPRTQGPDTKEVAQAKDDLAKLNKELADLRKAERAKENPPKTEDERRLVALEKQRDALFERVSKGDTSTKTGRPTADTPEQARVRAEIAALNKQMTGLRKAGKPIRPADQTQFNNLQKRLAAAEAKLAAGDLSTKPVAPTVETARVAKAREDLAAVNKQIRDLRNNSNDIRLARDKARLDRQIKQVQDRIAAGDYEQPTKREPATDREKLELEYKLAKEKEKWNEGLIKAKRAARPPGEKIWDAGVETINLGRQLLTSADLPPVFRQGLFGIGRPIQATKAAVDATKAMFSEKHRFKIMQEIENRPNAPLYSRSKLYLAKDTAQPLSQMEENFMGNWFKQLPRWSLVGPLLRASERSYNTFLNRMRADTFDSLVKAFDISETDTATLNSLAANINTFTGRSTLPLKKLEQAAPGLNTFLFAPRFMMSRFKVATGQPLWTGTRKSKLAALDTYARTLGGLAAIYGLASLGGGDVEIDPRSSDFGKIKFGQTRLDPLGGLSQVTTFLTRMTTGETKTGKGRTAPLREDYRPLQSLDSIFGTKTAAKGKPEMLVGDSTKVMGSFLRSKLNPIVGTTVNLASGKNLVGEKVTAGDALIDSTVPISWQEILTTMGAQGVPKGAALFILSLFGMGLNTYEDRKK